MTYALECEQLNKSFAGTPVVRNVSLQIHKGVFLTLLGPSGCGKTTTLRLIAGFENPDTGKICIDNKMMSGKGVHLPPEQRRIGMVFQEYALFPHLSVADNIGFGLQGNKNQKMQRTNILINLLGLDGLHHRMPYQLSGGQQQRVALARALAPEPQVLLLDEPFSNLDASLRAQVRADVKRILKATGITCIFVTHDQEEALSLSDQIAVMFEGHVMQVGTPSEIYQHPASREVAAFVGEANFIPADARGEFALSTIGQIWLATALHGQVDLMIRPENLQLGDDSSSGVAATIQWIEYYGHDQRIGVMLENGMPLTARLDSKLSYTVGQFVYVSVPGQVPAFPSGG